jgi:ATPase subunit of ABC transporter with duplicated ATPase domains
MISVDAVTVEFNGSALFSDITFNINENDRIALMGKNGQLSPTCLSTCLPKMIARCLKKPVRHFQKFTV